MTRWRHIEGLGWQPDNELDLDPPDLGASDTQSSAFRDSDEADWVSDRGIAEMLADGRLIGDR